jgi:hypothetical protein
MFWIANNQNLFALSEQLLLTKARMDARPTTAATDKKKKWGRGSSMRPALKLLKMSEPILRLPIGDVRTLSTLQLNPKTRVTND